MLGAGARSSDVDVKPVEARRFGVCMYKKFQKYDTTSLPKRFTSTYPVTLPLSPVRTNAKVVGGGEGLNVRRDGTDKLCSQ